MFLLDKLALKPSRDQLTSIKDHLYCLLNTRQGSLSHIPEYGLPDIVTLFQNLPDANFTFVTEVTKLIENYEPRLSQVQVSQVVEDNVDCVVHLVVSARLKNQKKIRLNTLFLSGGTASVH